MMTEEMITAFWNTPVGSAPNVPKEHAVKQEKILVMENMNKYYPFRTPCKALHTGFGVVGRYVGNAFEGSGIDIPEGKIWSIIFVATPGGTVIKTGRCYVNFELSDNELKTLKYYEDDAKNTATKVWYHNECETEELEKQGYFIEWDNIKPINI